jgi:hypothetical protein
MNADYAITYNSTILPDFILREIPVLQYAPGYFWKSGAVTYTNGQIQTHHNNDKNYNYKFCDFLIWKYCFHEMSPLDKIHNILSTFAHSKEMFPLPMNMSYAQYLIDEEFENTNNKNIPL